MNKLPQRLTLLVSIVAVVIAVLGVASRGEAAPAFNLVKILGASGGSTAQVSGGRLLVSEGPVKDRRVGARHRRGGIDPRRDPRDG